MSPIADCHICLFIFQHIYKPIISRCFLQETIKGDIAGGPGDVRLRRPEWNADIRTVRARQGLNIQKRGHPHWISSHLEHETGFEPATLALARRYSTTEPLVHTYLQNHILKSIFTVSSTNQTFLDKPSTD